jgi:hypothetical protein
VEKIVDRGVKRSDSGAYSSLAKPRRILLNLSTSLFSGSNPGAACDARSRAQDASGSNNSGGFPQSPMKIP